MLAKMSKLKKLIVLVSLLACLLIIWGFVISNNSDDRSKMILTKLEQQWLEEHPEIIYAIDPNWEPVEFQGEKGVIDGIAIDFLRIAESKLDIKFKLINIGSWNETVQALKDKEVDFISASYHETRVPYMNFTDTYYDIPYVYVVKKDWEGDVEFDDLHTLVVATVQGWVLNDILKENHPGIELVVYPTVSDALQAVSFGNVDLLIQELASVSHAIEINSITNLKSAGEYTETVDLNFAVRKDYVVLHQILSRVVKEISEQEKKAIISKWIRFEYYPFYKTKGFMNTFIGLLLLITLSLLWSYTLKRKVSQKTDELSRELTLNQKITKQLEDSLEDLKNIQQEVINQEKLASLGSMVAGMTHEVNNPLGVAYTTMSSLERSLNKVLKSYKEGKMTKTDFEDFLNHNTECVNMLERSLNQAIELLQGFKNMSVTQMYAEKVLFNVCDEIALINENMKYELKKKAVTIKINCIDSVTTENSKSAFNQILTNLIKNSIIHAFPDTHENNQITIDIKGGKDTILITYADNGDGISEENIEDIFHLLYTTKKNDGGSGLGLYIVKSLIEEEFGGRITCTSQEGLGTTFDIVLSK